MQNLRQLSDLAEAEIEKLSADGFTLTPRDIVQINALAWACETPESRLLLSRGVPVFVGGVALWPLTLYAAGWIERVGCKLQGGERQTLALAYAMAYGRSEGTELDVTERDADKAIAIWRRTLRCTPDELKEAITQVLNQDALIDAPASPGSHPMTAGELSAFLTAATGGRPELWERQVAVGYAFGLLTAILQQNKADDRPTAWDPRIRAERALGWCIERIRKRKTA